MAQFPITGNGRLDKEVSWAQLRHALLKCFSGTEDPLVEEALPAGFPFSLREEDEAVAVTPSVLESLLEHCLTGSRRAGTVYTPRFLVRWMSREAVSRWLNARLSPLEGGGETEAELLKRIRVLDLSAGAGAFTMGILHELVRRRRPLEPECSGADLVRMVVEENIYGVDINGTALETARDRFRCALRAEGDSGAFTDHLFVGDSLDMSPDGVWNNGLAPVMGDGGFDLVAGNPPFLGEKGNKELFERLKSSLLASYCSSRMDYWYVFACAGLDALKPGGVMHLIVPNKWLANAGAASLRRKLLGECSRLRMSDFGACRVFEGVRVHTMALLAEKKEGPGGVTAEYRRFSGTEARVEDFLENAPYGECVFPDDRAAAVKQGLFFCSSTEQALLDRLEALRNFELDPVREIAQGIVPNPDVVSSRSLEVMRRGLELHGNIRRGEGVFVVSQDHFRNLPEQERQFLKPLYEPHLAQRYGLQEAKKVLLYLTPFNGSERASGLISHLERFRPLMEARRENRMRRLQFYHVHWPRKEDFFRTGPKILSVRKCCRPTFTYTEKEAYVMMAFNVIRTERLSMKYLAALFNSRLMQFWFRMRGKMQGDFFQVDSAPILRAPVRVPAAAAVREVEILADSLTARYCPEDDERMNMLVEAVYGVSPEEREVMIRACSAAPASKENKPE